MFKKDSETTTTVESMYTVHTSGEAQHPPRDLEDVLARVHTRTINNGVPLCSLEIHTTGRNGKLQVKLVEVQVNDLVHLRDMLTAVCEDLGRGES